MPSEAPASEALRHLLMDAHQQAAMVDAKDKVLALTGVLTEGEDGGAEMAIANVTSNEDTQMLPYGVHFKQLPDNFPLCEARKILDRLSGFRDAEDEAFVEADQTLLALESDVNSLETGDELPASPGKEQNPS